MNIIDIQNFVNKHLVICPAHTVLWSGGGGVQVCLSTWMNHHSQTRRLVIQHWLDNWTRPNRGTPTHSACI